MSSGLVIIVSINMGNASTTTLGIADLSNVIWSFSYLIRSNAPDKIYHYCGNYKWFMGTSCYWNFFSSRTSIGYVSIFIIRFAIAWAASLSIPKIYCKLSEISSGFPDDIWTVVQELGIDDAFADWVKEHPWKT